VKKAKSRQITHNGRHPAQPLFDEVTRICIASKNQPPLDAMKYDVVEDSAERPWCPMFMAAEFL